MDPTVTAAKAIASQSRPPLYNQRPPRWVRWSWATIACDFIFFSNAMYITWHHWSESVPAVTDTASSKTKIPTLDSPSPPAEQWRLRPVYQRMGLCAAFFVTGCGIAGGLLWGKSRVVRTLTIIPTRAEAPTSTASTRQLLMQSASSANDEGMVIPFSKCSLWEGRDTTEMLIQMEGKKGSWQMSLDKAIINGKQMPTVEARKTILDEWKGGKLRGRWTAEAAADSRWKRGPVRKM